MSTAQGSSLRTRPAPTAPAVIPAPESTPGATTVTTAAAAPAIPAPEPTDPPGVKERIDGLATRTRAAEERAAALERQLAEAVTGRVKAERAAVLIGAKVTAPSVQRALGREYDSYVAEVGDKALPFGDWIETEAKTDPLFSPHFTVAAPVATPAATTTPAANPAVTTPAATAPAVTTPVVIPPNPNNGTVAAPVQPGHVFTDAEMNDTTWSLNADAIKKQMEQGVGGVKVILPQPRKK